MLGIVSTLERPAYSVLSNELNRVKREYGIDIRERNKWDIRITKHGKLENFARLDGSVTRRTPNWFGADDAVAVSMQLKVIKFVQRQDGWRSK